MTQDRLDKLLKQWAAAHATSEEHARKLSDRIADELAASHLRVLDPAADWRVPRPRRRRLPWAPLGIAAALLVAATVSLFLRWPSVPDGVVPDSEAASSPAAAIDPAELHAGARLFQEMEALFANDLRWVADTDDTVRLGVRPTSGAPVAGETRLMIRVVVLRRGRDATSWHELMKADLFARSQELVEAVLDPKLDNRLVLWAYALPDGKVAIDSSLRLTTPIRASVDATNVLTPGKSASVLSLETEDAEYRICEVVTPLPKQKHEGV